TTALARAGVGPVPPAPGYPSSLAAASAEHARTFPTLVDLARGRLGPEELATAALRELLRRRRAGHTFLLAPRMQRAPPAGPRRAFGPILTDTSPLTVADTVPRGPAQRVGLRRGQEVLAINGEPCADLRRFEAMALLDRRADASNRLAVRDRSGETRV